MNMNNKQTVRWEEYRSLDNRVTCILQQRWSANEISQWVGLLKGKQQSVSCAATLDPRSWPCQPPPYRGRAPPRGHRPEQLNPRYNPALHQVVADQRQHMEAAAKP